MAWCATTLDTQYNVFIPLATHELAHTFYLDDTYLDSAYDPYADGWCDRYNVTQDTINNPIPGGGPYILGGQYDNNHWRNGNDRMRALNYGFGHASKEVIKAFIPYFCTTGDCTWVEECQTY